MQYTYDLTSAIRDIVFWARAVQFAQGPVGAGPFCDISAEEWEIAHVAIAQVAPDLCEYSD